MKMKHAQFQISFSWLFAIIVGAFILFLAIYASTKLINIGQTEQDVKAGTEINILLNPLETSFESGKVISFSMPVESRIYSKCDNRGVFGTQKLSVSQISFNEWTETDLDVSSYNKYIFADIPSEGKNFYVFSKPFEFPFKVADLIYLIPSEKKYCFTDAPENIEEELEKLNIKNIFMENCSGSEIKVCFEGVCDIRVNYEGNYVKKGNDVNYFYSDALMYAIIFSDSNLYECQVKRLMQRTGQLALLYNDKAKFIENKGCDSNLGLQIFRGEVENFEDSSDLEFIAISAEDIQDKNNANWECKLW